MGKAALETLLVPLRDNTYRGMAPRVFRNALWVFRHTHYPLAINPFCHGGHNPPPHSDVTAFSEDFLSFSADSHGHMLLIKIKHHDKNNN